MDFSTASQRGYDGKLEPDLTGICLEISGAITGSILLLMSVENACRLAGLLLRSPLPSSTDDEALRSTLREVGNIFASGVLGSLDDGLKLRALPSPPVCLSGSRQQIQNQCRQCLKQPLGLQVEAGLNCHVGEADLIRSEILFRLVEEQIPT